MKEGIYYEKSENSIKWSAFEFLYHEKDKQWFLVFWIITGGVLLSLLIFGNIFGVATMAMFAVILYIYALKKPEILQCRIDNEGVTSNDKLFTFSEIKSFWVLYEPPVKELILISKNKMSPKISMPIGKADPTDIRDLLLENGLKEEEEEESLSDLIARRLRF